MALFLKIDPGKPDEEKLAEAGSYTKARELGWLKTEGKDYIVQDGDVIEFKI